METERSSHHFGSSSVTILLLDGAEPAGMACFWIAWDSLYQLTTHRWTTRPSDIESEECLSLFNTAWRRSAIFCQCPQCCPLSRESGVECRTLNYVESIPHCSQHHLPQLFEAENEPTPEPAELLQSTAAVWGTALLQETIWRTSRHNEIKQHTVRISQTKWFSDRKIQEVDFTLHPDHRQPLGTIPTPRFRRHRFYPSLRRPVSSQSYRGTECGKKSLKNEAKVRNSTSKLAEHWS